MFLNEVQVDETWAVRGQPVTDEYITPGKKIRTYAKSLRQIERSQDDRRCHMVMGKDPGHRL